MNIGFRISSPGKWTGGINYLLNVANAIHLNNPFHKSQFFMGEKYHEIYKSQIAAVSSSPIRTMQDPTKPALALAMLGRRNRLIESEMTSANVDVYFESHDYLAPNPKIPIVSWIPDFQHRHLPRFFSQKAWWLREMRIRRILQTREHILLSSHDSLRDMIQFYGQPPGKVHVVPFSVMAPSWACWTVGEKVRTELNLPERYVFLPNQFWAHKNHAIVIEALALLGDSAPYVVASGNPHDERAPALYRKLTDKILELGLSERFRMIGNIPFQSVLALNARADALINPSLFEGWSTTVEEAKSIGTPLLLSDIPVHHEQAGQQAAYFSPNSPDECASALATVAKAPARVLSVHSESAPANINYKKFGEELTQVFLLAGLK